MLLVRQQQRFCFPLTRAAALRAAAPARDIRATLSLLHRVPSLRPRAVLPGPGLGSPVHLLALPPRGIADVLVEHLAWRGLLTDRVATREVRRIIELAPDVDSIS